ncbi:heptaprenyl diphosphate synthase component 1 [Cohnella yongneupensis]|uniref:Heptaprenyl diphosphate synthase component 1 n=1 Tax=Cohnella yongneupensis TaxID=425006 RepID=A0ABW0R4R9_9BACL
MTRARISQLADKYMSHDMITLHTELSDFPEGRISLLYALLSHQPAAAQHKELLSVVTSLVQMGLDTHDLVDNDSAPARSGMKAMRAQQLKVLAGDYFSSRFYQLLSQAGQIDMVRQLSEAVCDINRSKMTLYAKMIQLKLSAEEYVQHAAEIKSGLFLSFTGVMGGLYERVWPELIERFSRCEVLLHELTRIQKLSKLESSWGVWHILQDGTEEDRRTLRDRREDQGIIKGLLNKYAVSEKLAGLLRQSAAQLQALAQRLQSDKLLRELQPLIEPFVQAAGPQPATALKELG